MKMKKRFVATLVAAATMAAMVLPTLADTVWKTIDVSTGVRVMVDDKALDAGDTHGNPEAFIYNGTTYIAVAAVSKSLGEKVAWDGNTKTVYIGDHEDGSFELLADKEYFYSDKTFASVSQKDNLSQQHVKALKVTSMGKASETYVLNGEYKKLTGTCFISYSGRLLDFGSNAEYGWKIYGDGKLLYELHPQGQGFYPTDFEVDLTGVLELTVEIANKGLNDALCIGEAKLFK